MSTYIQLLKAAQLATTREEAQKILDYMKSLDLLNSLYHQQSVDIAAK